MVDLVKPFGTHALSWMAPINRENRAVLAVDRYLSHWGGPLTIQTRDDLDKNDLRGLDLLFYLMAGDPTPGQ